LNYQEPFKLSYFLENSLAGEDLLFSFLRDCPVEVPPHAALLIHIDLRYLLIPSEHLDCQVFQLQPHQPSYQDIQNQILKDYVYVVRGKHRRAVIKVMSDTNV